MKSSCSFLSLVLVAATLILQTAVLGFTTTTATNNNCRSVGAVASRGTSTTALNFFGGAPKDDGSPGDYVCKDCGWVYTKGPQAWAKESNDDFACPPCGAPKRRFKKVPKGSAAGGKVEVKKSWFGK